MEGDCEFRVQANITIINETDQRLIPNLTVWPSHVGGEYKCSDTAIIL